MTESEFLTINPTNYGNGTCLIFYDQTLDPLRPEAENTAYPLYSDVPSYPSSSEYTIHNIIGMSVPFNSLNGIDVSATSTNVNTITFNVPSPDPNTQNSNLPVNQVRADVVSIQQQSSWVYYKVENARILNPLVTGSEPPFQTDGVSLWSQSADINGVTSSMYTYGSTASAEGPQSESLFIFNSYVDGTFNQADENPLQNNATVLRRSSFLMESRREALKPVTVNGTYPPNLDQIRSGSARPAAIPDSNYTSIGYRRGRYDGSNYTSSYVDTGNYLNLADGTVTALNLVEFLATTHSFSSSFQELLALPLEERGDVQRLYYNPATSVPSGVNNAGVSASYANDIGVPDLYDSVYADEGNRVAKVANKAVVFITPPNITLTSGSWLGVRTHVEGYVVRRY